MRKTIYIGLMVVLVLLSAYMVSAGFGDWIKSITGYEVYDVNVSVTGVSAVTVIVYNNTIGAVTPTESGEVGVEFTVLINDTDGEGDIDDNSVGANFSKAGEQLRANTTCVLKSGESGFYSHNFSCNVTMYWFDAPGTWAITAWGNDTGNGTTQYNTTTDFQYNTLQTIDISPAALTWPGISPGQTNRTSDNDPTLINNTGNYNITNFTITGISLVGETSTSEFIDVANFTSDIETAGGNPECLVNATSGVTLSNNTALQVFGAQALRGNYTINDGTTGQEQIYYCIPLIPPVQTQAYSAPTAWTITLI